MALGKQAKTLNRQQIDGVLGYVGSRRQGLRNQVIFLLSVKAGLRAKEIAQLKWSMIIDAYGELSDQICLTDAASKGKSGRIIPINRDLRGLLLRLYAVDRQQPAFDPASSKVVRTERTEQASAQVIVNLFRRWYSELGLIGCSSHSGRRTFITNAAKKISFVGGSLKDVQLLAGHTSLQTTQRYIEGDVIARKKIVDLI